MAKPAAAATSRRKPVPGLARGQCLCGAVRIEIDTPVFWAWHDHAASTQRAQGCAYATYVGCWKSKVRIVAGESHVTRYLDPDTGAARSFCARCGSPLLYERAHAPRMVNLPRALFDERTGREPRYHLHMDEAPDWAYAGATLGPLKGYPGVLWERPRKPPARRRPEPMF